MKRIKEVFLFEPHNAVISGMTGCRKTLFILDLLETVYKGHFENIVIFCPTFDYNKTYDREWIYNKTYDREWIFKDKNVFILDPVFVKENLNHAIYFTSEVFKGTNSLFVIDDCANIHVTKYKGKELCNLAFSGRHYGITTWVLVQKYNALVKDFRENARTLVLFFNKDGNAMEQAFKENRIVPDDMTNKITLYLKALFYLLVGLRIFSLKIRCRTENKNKNNFRKVLITQLRLTNLEHMLPLAPQTK